MQVSIRAYMVVSYTDFVLLYVLYYYVVLYYIIRGVRIYPPLVSGRVGVSVLVLVHRTHKTSERVWG